MSAFAVVVLVHVWIVSAGWFTFWPRYTSDYSLLADSFLHGQLSLRIEPAAQLLALRDPYDPKLNQSLRLHDLSLYRGKYYMYWGPVPAIVEMPVLWLFRTPIGDQFLTFAFVFGLVLGAMQLMLEIRWQSFPNPPPWTMAVGVLVFGLATPIPFLLGRAAVYEAAIAAGQCFLVWGIYFAIKGLAAAEFLPLPVLRGRAGVGVLSIDCQPRLTRTPTLSLSRSTGRGDKGLLALSPLSFMLAGTCWALAVGSRSSLAVCVIVLTLVILAVTCQHDSRPRRRRCLAALLTPLIVGVVLLGAYNAARFGRWTEMGTQYQLAAYAPKGLFSIHNVVPNLYAYALKPVAALQAFPFVQALGGANTFPSWIALPHDYLPTEPVAGLIWCCPFLVFALISVGSLLRPALHDSKLKQVIALLLMATVLSGLPPLFLLAATMRYLADFVPCLTLLAILGWWQVSSGRQGRPRLMLGLVLALYSIAVGVLLAVIGNSEHFPTYHPGYWGM